ncbi:MAG: hypothetical protein ACNA7G_09655 [Methylobacter sp.]
MNVYQQFQALIPRAAQIIAIVQTEHSDGTSTCLTLDNQSIRVRGTNGRVSGDRVFVAIDPALGASIIGDAPELQGYVVEV